MKEREYKEVPKVEKVINSITCNKCGKVKDVSHVNGPEKDWELGEYVTLFTQTFGYGSIYDGETWEIDLCEDCTKEFIGSLKYSPKED